METRDDLFPENTQLHLGQTVTHAAMNAEAEGDVIPSVWAVDDEAIRIRKNVLVMIAR